MRLWIPLVAVALTAAAEKPRVFVTESGTIQLAGKAADAGNSLTVTGLTTPQNLEVIRNFGRLCPNVVVTSNREKADFVVRLDHEELNPWTPFFRGNKLAVFNKDEDLILSTSTRFLRNVVKAACGAIAGAGR